ncbi:helix-turn-helix transcriptional regulator [uncultured Pseudoramibacter sp.]|uniref:helix-turn-helix transcriptional regulator n=1 Tax=uncultured Pseudoramibacter sp. TaxID=1623493 RepID=UPI0025FEE144|nr:helix-turn-helix transcriptional regulator [uncultured Pseudoramibacter sp.]
MKIKEIRKKLHLSQRKLAEIITENGHDCSYRTIQNIEGGKNNPSFGFMAAFLRAFPEYSIDEIFFTDEDLE